MKRLYSQIVEEHFTSLDQMAFLAGPRQVGKTTITKEVCEEEGDFLYLNWDYSPEREIILSGADKIITRVMNQKLGKKTIPMVAFDEIHKYKNWKNYLKGYFDHTKGKIKTLVTGSAKLDIYKKRGDSLMGRYFLYHIHPLSVGELLQRKYTAQKLNAPQRLKEELWQALVEFGGFPEPFLKRNRRFLNRWQQLRAQQLFREDIKTLASVSDLSQMEILGKLLKDRVGSQINYHNLATMVQVSDKTVKHWLNVLESFYYCFTLRPWSKNLSRALVKEPKVYLWDWSLVESKGARVENFIASHLLKAVHYWTDIGLGKYELYYLRDKDKREVDFLIVQDEKPWVLLEVKSSDNQPISTHLLHFQKQLQAEHVFQVAFDMPYVHEDCFAVRKPIIVPARTLLSQLI